MSELRFGLTSLTGSPAWYEPCTGEGKTTEDTQHGNTICPVCRGIAPVTDGKVDAHDVRVID